MVARRSSSDPVSHYLVTGETIVWRHQPPARTLFYNRLPLVIIVLAMTAFVLVIAANVVGSALGPPPYEPSAWLILPAGAALFFCLLLYAFAGAAWNHIRFLTDSWSTHYALTDRRFVIVSNRGVINYDASFFRKMEALGGASGEHILLFDWGPAGKRKTDHYRDRIAGLPDASKLERLIRDTLRA